MNKIKIHIKALEEKLLHSDFKKNPEILKQLLGDDFEEIGSLGKTSSREEVVHWLITKEKDIQWTLNEFRIREITPDVVIAIYRATITGNKRCHSIGSIRSSIWKMYDGNWKMVFHQATKTVDVKQT